MTVISKMTIISPTIIRTLTIINIMTIVRAVVIINTMTLINMIIIIRTMTFISTMIVINMMIKHHHFGNSHFHKAWALQKPSCTFFELFPGLILCLDESQDPLKFFKTINLSGVRIRTPTMNLLGCYKPCERKNMFKTFYAGY
ncbi:hypothetical protein HELRODRAFT_177470 [Helobdella robusta]|uniref:Uncharacterized protein n=1 Tax=Helobdella robusta TaxID=6412 RepID=T1FBR1_HELRO|nr:hypothetical protein HELRODRAFT_177470 [Helobdella robusta]ESN97835.1 hypothetical protein HELRODRAFT_177470 [Helobdella robusta]